MQYSRSMIFVGVSCKVPRGNRLKSYKSNLVLFRAVTHKTFSHTILWYKEIFEPWISTGQGKLLTKSRYIKKLIKVCFFRAYHGWSLKHVDRNDLFNQNYLLIAISFYCNIFLSQYLFIAISFYRNIVRENV